MTTSEARRAELWRRAALASTLLWLLASAVALRLYLDHLPPPAAPSAPPPEVERLVLVPGSFERLPGWRDDAVSEALPALLASCRALLAQPAERPLGPDGLAGRVADWQGPCAELRRVVPGDDDGLRRLLTARFQVFRVFDDTRRTGLFTGYYEPLLHGSRRRGGAFVVPLYARPHDIVTIDLGRFRDELAGQRLAGRLVGSSLQPYPDRAAIDGGALGGRGLELLWVDDPIDAFFLQIQGSGRVELAEGGSLRVGYDGQNGQPYLPIGRALVERGALAPEEVSMQSIRAWLAAHPQQAPEILRLNRSFVFFRTLAGRAPVGSQGVELTAGRSLAVDTRHLPLGAPLWLEAMAPAARPGDPDRTLRRLMVAQDTGGAIRGPVRGDVYWGSGAEAASIAGRMRHRGRLWLLLPRGVEPPATTAGAAAVNPAR